jgi:histidinol-phosphate aminotransferase
LHGYVPGEQPRGRGIIKLNTNENPYSPSIRVLEAVKAAVDGRLRLYPNATAEGLREKLAAFHGCKPENVIVGNGSDELLALATRAFVEPNAGSATTVDGARARRLRSRSTVQYFTPSYSLYPVLTSIHGGISREYPLADDFALPSIPTLRQNGKWDFSAALTLITTPNAPGGRGYSRKELEQICAAQKGVVVLDEAYVDFGVEDALDLALRHSHVLAARTFSKAYCLCFLRVGYMVGHPELISALHSIRDSYNVNGLGQIAAEATLEALPYYQENFRRIIATREHASIELARMGFEVTPSQTNFIRVRPPRFKAEEWLARLRDRKILVRWFGHSRVADCLRITIGTDAEMDALLRAAKAILRS